MSSEAERRGIDDAGRMYDLSAKAKVLTPFEQELLEAVRLLTQRVGEIASAIEALKEAPPDPNPLWPGTR